VGSDSGRIVVLEYDHDKKQFIKHHQETFGKSGLRRGVPGQYLATDPMGRAVMIGAMERTKFGYILARDADSKLTISSPLESHKNNTVCSALVALHVGYENPMYASLEVDFGDSDQDPTGAAYMEVQKHVLFYELDLGLNHVVRKWSSPVDMSSNHLVPIPGGQNDGPSGVLVCSEGFLTWYHHEYDSVRIAIPTRSDPLDSDNPNLDRTPTIVIASVVHHTKKAFFILLQSEIGDVFKVTMDYVTDSDGIVGQVANIRIRYFETLNPSSGLCLLKSGFLFNASEFGNHVLYQIENLGDDDEEQREFQSIEWDAKEEWSFQPRELRNISPVDELESMCPLIDATVANLTDEDSPQIYALCGNGARSTFRTLRHGLSVTEIAVSELPGNPNAVWTVKGAFDDEYDSYIIISFVNATLVLSIGETVEEVTDTGILVNTPTLCVGQLGDDALVQVYPSGIRHIRMDKRVSEWRAPKGQTIIQGDCNHRQVAIALSGGEIVYFELDFSGNLNEFQDRKQLNGQATAITMSPIPEGRQRALFLAVACADNTVRVLSLDANSCMESVSMQALSAPAESLALTEMIDPTTSVTTLYLNMGLSNGVFLRTTIDNITGLLTDVRQRFLGPKAVKLFSVKLAGSSAVLALSTQPWLSYSYQSRTKLIPLSYECLEYGSSFSSEQCPEGIVAIAENTLRILNVDKLSSVFNQVSVKLKYTPRRLLLHEASKNFVIIESENGTLCPAERLQIITGKVFVIDVVSGP
jgi:splicing factor 3B subunit 3